VELEPAGAAALLRLFQREAGDDARDPAQRRFLDGAQQLEARPLGTLQPLPDLGEGATAPARRAAELGPEAGRIVAEESELLVLVEVAAKVAHHASSSTSCVAIRSSGRRRLDEAGDG